MKLGTREIAFNLLLAAILVGAWWFVFRPNAARKAEMLAEIEAKQEKLRSLNQATATIGDLKQEIASLDKAIGFFRSKLPTEKEMDKVLREVWRLAEANHLTTKSIRQLNSKSEMILTEEAGPYAEQPISVKLEGHFAGFYGFLLALERQPRIMRIQEMEIAKHRKAPDGHIDAECKISVFFEPSDKE